MRRCWFHGFGLIMGSCLQQAELLSAVKYGQRIVTFVHKSHATRAALKELRRVLEIKGGGLQVRYACMALLIACARTPPCCLVH